jgi:adenylate kinase
MMFIRLKQTDVKERGFVCEGFPRTKQQAIMLVHEKIIIRHMIEVDVPNAKIIERAEGLRFDPVTNRVYQ